MMMSGFGVPQKICPNSLNANTDIFIFEEVNVLEPHAIGAWVLRAYVKYYWDGLQSVLHILLPGNLNLSSSLIVCLAMVV